MSRSSIKKLPRDSNQRAFEIVRLSTEEPEEPKAEEPVIKDTRSEVSKYLSTIGRAGGLKGGKVRAERLSAKKRSDIAKKAAATRWAKKKPKQNNNQ